MIRLLYSFLLGLFVLLGTGNALAAAVEKPTENKVEANVASSPASDTAPSNVAPSSQIKTDASKLAPQDKSKGVGAGDWAVMFLSLGLIVALILFLAWLARRFGGLRAMGVRDMKVLSAMPLGTREKLALVEVKGKQILVGVTPNNISHLHTFSPAELEAAQPQLENQNQSEFALKLKKVMMRGSGKEELAIGKERSDDA
jgi:flagellar biosynthetic protein FliO